jgi:uncharacterized protein YjbJ (UPF0337 family)
MQMNKDQVKGAAREAAGKVQKAAGDLVGSQKQEAKGMAKEAAGKIQKNYGDAKSDAKQAADRADDRLDEDDRA